MDERREDWRHGVDENLASLNTGQRVNDRLIEDFDLAVSRIDNILRGNPEEETSGLIGRMEKTETDVAQLKSIVIMDASGKKGLQHEVAILSSGERTASDRWKFATAVVVACISLIGLLITNWDRIQIYINRRTQDKVNQMIENTSRPKSHHRRYVIHEEPLDDN